VRHNYYRTSPSIGCDGGALYWVYFYPTSKRYVLNKLSLVDLQNFKTKEAKKVGVFVNEPLDNLLNIVKEAGLDLVQLHGDEDFAYCEMVKKQVPVVKVFRVGALVPMMEGFDQVADYFYLILIVHYMVGQDNILIGRLSKIK